MAFQDVSHHAGVADFVADIIPCPMNDSSWYQSWISTRVTRQHWKNEQRKQKDKDMSKCF